MKRPCGDRTAVKVLDEKKPYVVRCELDQQLPSYKILVENRNPEHNAEAIMQIHEIKVYGSYFELEGI